MLSVNPHGSTASSSPLVLTHRLKSPAIFTLDARGHILTASTSAEGFWLTEISRLKGQPFVSLFIFDVASSLTFRHEMQWDMLLATALNRSMICAARLPDHAPCDVQIRIEENRGTAEGGYFAWVEDPAKRRDSAPPLIVDSGLAILADQGSIGFFDLNFKAGQTYYSPAWKRLLGYGDAELFNTYDSWLRLLHPEDSAAAPDQPSSKNSTGIRSFSVEVRMRHRRGHYVWVHCVGAQVFSNTGALERVTGLQIDISERKEHEDQTFATSERFFRLTGEGELAAFDFDFIRREYWLAPAWTRLLGVPTTTGVETLNTFLAALTPASAALGLHPYFLAPCPGQRSFIACERVVKQDGTQLPVLIGGHREISRGGELLRVVGFINPLPEGFESITDSPIPPSLLGDVLDSLSEALILADTQGNVSYLNSNAARLTGYAPEQAVGQPLIDIFRLARRSDGYLADDALNAALAGSEHSPLCDEHTLVSSDNINARPIVWSVRQVRSNTKKDRSNLIIIFRDPDEMTLTPEELVKTNRFETLGVVAGGIAHDFNNLLTTILGGISQAKENRDYSFLPDSERACLAAKALTKQLLSAARGNPSNTKITLAPAEILRDATRIARSGANAEIVIDAPDNVGAITVDRSQMLQVFQNLIVNSLQALPSAGGRIILRSRQVALPTEIETPLQPGLYVELSVIDNGCGIPEELIDRIFEPFFTTKKTGTGLGLPTVRNIVLRHGGHIHVQSKPGAGTEFIILIPQASRPLDEVDTRHTPALRFGTGRILLMDDDHDIGRLTAGMLESLEYRHDVAHNGEEAISLYQRYLKIGRPYDAVLLDLTIVGGMGGEETFQQLRQLDPDVRAIVCTGYDNDELAQEFLDKGFRGYLSKPYRVGDLSRVLKKVIG